MVSKSWQRKWWLGGASLMMLLVMAQYGCGPDFSPYWRVDKLRVLSMKADPVTLRPGESADLDVLVYVPEGEEVTYQWDWCPFQTSADTQYECPVSREDLIALLRDGIPPEDVPEGFDVDMLLELLVPEFDLGTEATAKFPYPGSPEFILGICNSLQLSLAGEDNELNDDARVSDCEQGYEATFRVTLTTSSGEEFVSAKRILLWTGSELEDNENPDVNGIEIRLQNPDDLDKVVNKLDWIMASEATGERWYLLREGESTPLVAGVPYEIRSRVNPDSLQMFQRPAPVATNNATQSEDEFLPPEPEALVFRWFVTGGDLDDSRRIWAPGINTIEEAGTSVFNVPLSQDAPNDWDQDGVNNSDDACPYIANGDGSEDACTLSIWSVVRDGRLGVDWIERRVEVVDHVE